MNNAIITVMLILAIAAGAQASGNVYESDDSGLENAGYRLFVSDNILNTVAKPDPGMGSAPYCAGNEEDTAKHIGDISTVRADRRVPIAADAKISYSSACNTYYSVVERLKTADDIRRLWLLFADSATDNFAAETLKKSKENEDPSLLIEMKRLAIVSEYIEFFTRNKDWKLTDYTFLSQAFKARKEKPLSPAFSQFIAGLLTGDADKAFQIVKSIDLNNLGSRFTIPAVKDNSKTKSVDMRK